MAHEVGFKDIENSEAKFLIIFLFTVWFFMTTIIWLGICFSFNCNETLTKGSYYQASTPPTFIRAFTSQKDYVMGGLRVFAEFFKTLKFK